MAETHANQRHRPDGRWPSGNSSSANVPINPIGGIQSHSVNERIQSAAGRCDTNNP